MSETLNVDLTKRQRELLLRGLRFVRSSIMLEVRNPTPDDEQQRSTELRNIAELVAQLNGNCPANTAARL